MSDESELREKLAKVIEIELHDLAFGEHRLGSTSDNLADAILPLVQDQLAAAIHEATVLMIPLHEAVAEKDRAVARATVDALAQVTALRECADRMANWVAFWLRSEKEESLTIARQDLAKARQLLAPKGSKETT